MAPAGTGEVKFDSTLPSAFSKVHGLPIEPSPLAVAVGETYLFVGHGAGHGGGVGTGVGPGVGVGVGNGVGVGAGVELTVTELLVATRLKLLLRDKRNSYCPATRGAFNVKLPVGDPPVYLHHSSLPAIWGAPTL